MPNNYYFEWISVNWRGWTSWKENFQFPIQSKRPCLRWELFSFLIFPSNWTQRTFWIYPKVKFFGKFSFEERLPFVPLENVEKLETSDLWLMETENGVFEATNARWSYLFWTSTSPAAPRTRQDVEGSDKRRKSNSPSRSEQIASDDLFPIRIATLAFANASSCRCRRIQQTLKWTSSFKGQMDSNYDYKTATAIAEWLTLKEQNRQMDEKLASNKERMQLLLKEFPQIGNVVGMLKKEKKPKVEPPSAPAPSVTTTSTSSSVVVGSPSSTTSSGVKRKAPSSLEKPPEKKKTKGTKESLRAKMEELKKESAPPKDRTSAKEKGGGIFHPTSHSNPPTHLDPSV